MVVDWPDLEDKAGKSRADAEESETGKDDQNDHQRVFILFGLGSLIPRLFSTFLLLGAAQLFPLGLAQAFRTLPLALGTGCRLTFSL